MERIDELLKALSLDGDTELLDQVNEVLKRKADPVNETDKKRSEKQGGSQWRGFVGTNVDRLNAHLQRR